MLYIKQSNFGGSKKKEVDVQRVAQQGEDTLDFFYFKSCSVCP